MTAPVARTWRADDGWHIDVRGLAPPAPLVAILRLVESIGDGTAVTVHHDRDPQLLYPELAERGWSAERIDGEPGEVRLRLTLDDREGARPSAAPVAACPTGVCPKVG